MNHQPQNGRLHGLDALRGFALILGLVVHGSLAFLPGADRFWFAHDPQPSLALGLAFYVPHMFRMLLFFLMAGFFARLSLQRLGTRAFARDRFRRITLVLIVFWPILFASTIAAAIVASTKASVPPPTPAFTPGDFPLTHLWFLYVLSLCYAIALTTRWLIVKADSERLMTAADRLLPLLTGKLGPAILAVPLAAALTLRANWLPWFGVPTPDSSLYPNFPACVAFGSAFIMGWLLHRQPTQLSRLSDTWPYHLAMAVIATMACLSIIGLSPSLLPATSGARIIIYAALYAWGGWSWALSLTGLALRYLSSNSPARRYLADASYWIYLTHLPVIIVLQAWTVHLPISAPAKFVVVVGGTLALLLACYQLFVRATWIGRFLGCRGPQTNYRIFEAPRHG